MSAEERSHASNAIWLCRDHGKAVDSDEKQFTVKLLRDWKKQAEEDAWRRVLRNEAPPATAAVTANDNVLSKIYQAAKDDLAAFRNTMKWPRSSVALTLEGYGEPATTSALASAVRTLDDLILVAPPGMGKTTTLFQIADGILASNSGVPLVVHLGDWATENMPILDSILKRHAFRYVTEGDLRTLAREPGVVLLLDGWNELDAIARGRARVQVETLKSELPELGLVVSTRKQVLDVPFPGKIVELMPLGDEQQMKIARAMRGDGGAKIVDQAWRTPGVRELVQIPLYLTALMSLPDDAPFPETKEEVLRRFVAAHEKDPRRAEALRATIRGFQQEYLKDLAVFATQTANTAVADSNARRSISKTETRLVASGQIAMKPEPDAVLDVLVDNHVLMRAGDMLGVSFQHQQLQEWYASHTVERRILANIGDPVQREALKAEMFNLPAWEKAILFAVERMARGDAAEKAACGKAILAAFEVDPLLAAEMIYRATDEVWNPIATTIKKRVGRWHVPGRSDRALRFMMNSGRPEFVEHIWPLITDENDQVSLRAIRNCRRFRPAVLGLDAAKRIKALASKPRLVLLHEIASKSGIEGLDLVTSIAKHDPDPGVQASVAEALAFRRADRHLTELLKDATDTTFDLVARKSPWIVGDDIVNKGLAAARERQARKSISSHDRLREMAFANEDGSSAEMTTVISEMEVDKRQETVELVYAAYKRHPRAVTEGLLARVRAGRPLFFGVGDILASAGYSLEDDEFLKLALADSPNRDDRAEAAASVLGPTAVGKMIDALFEVATRRLDRGRYDEVAVNRYQVIQERIAHVPTSSLVAAVQARSADADNEQIALLSELLSRHPNGAFGRTIPFDADAVSAIRELVKNWGDRMLASGNAERSQMANIALLARHVPDVSLLPLLKRLLDDNLRRYRAFREEATSSGWRQSKAAHEARTPTTQEYQWAFLAIDAPETAMLMREYLADPHFGELAAGVLAAQWRTANEPPRDQRVLGSIDFTRMKEKRTARAANPAGSSAEAEAIFAVIEHLISDKATDDQKNLIVALGIVAVGLPHGQRDAMIDKLLKLTPRRSRPRLLLNLILSGTVIDSKLVTDGIAETFEAAKKEAWILTQSDGYELPMWLRLLPFTNRPSVALEVVRGLPEAQRAPYLLRELVDGLAETPSEGSEEVLFMLAREDPRFYQDRHWRDAVLKLGTASAAHRIVDLITSGAFDTKSFDHSLWERELAALIAKFPEVRSHVYRLLREGMTSKYLAVLARAVSENPDTEGFLLLVDIENKQKLSIVGWHTIEQVVTEHVPIENWSGAYNVVPRPAVELRRKLLAKTTDGGATDAAARCLDTIDVMRDEYGIPLSEPRHPDLASGKPWPIMTADSGCDSRRLAVRVLKS